mgnify:CR=1 FL=1
MKDRFTHKSRKGIRGKIPKKMRNEVYQRDNYQCGFCFEDFSNNRRELTIDHIIPLAKDGLDEMSNYIAACRKCNESKKDLPIAEFAKRINIRISDLPAHGDPIIDNKELPIQLRMIRKRIFDTARNNDSSLRSTSAQKKLEKKYRMNFWETKEGRDLKHKFPTLPGPARIMIPEIETIAKSKEEFYLLIELAKSAKTRNIIGTILTSDCDVLKRTKSLLEKTKDDSLKKRLSASWKRFEKNALK